MKFWKKILIIIFVYKNSSEIITLGKLNINLKCIVYKNKHPRTAKKLNFILHYDENII